MPRMVNAFFWLRGVAVVSGLLLMIALVSMPAARAQQKPVGKEPPRATPGAKVAPARAAGRTARFLPTPWEVRCASAGSGKVGCSLTRAIVEVNTRQTLVRLSIAGDRKRMTLQLPHGLDLRQPVQLEVDGKELGKARFATSRRTGAFALMPLNAKVLQRMKQGKSLTVRMKVFSGAPLNVKMDLKGFAAALKKL